MSLSIEISNSRGDYRDHHVELAERMILEDRYIVNSGVDSDAEEVTTGYSYIVSVKDPVTNVVKTYTRTRPRFT